MILAELFFQLMDCPVDCAKQARTACLRNEIRSAINRHTNFYVRLALLFEIDRDVGGGNFVVETA